MNVDMMAVQISFMCVDYKETFLLRNSSTGAFPQALSSLCPRLMMSAIMPPLNMPTSLPSNISFQVKGFPLPFRKVSFLFLTPTSGFLLNSVSEENF